MLTNKQHELLSFIKKRMSEKGVPPSFEEMKEAVHLKSKSGIHRLIIALEERGYLRRLPNRARAIEIIKLPGDTIKTNKIHEETENIINANFNSNHNNLDKIPLRENLKIPLYGKIAAGIPIEALTNPSEFLELPSDFCLNDGDHYALTIDGDSMIEEGIIDGDTVIIKNTNQAENGAIVVALIDQEEATLKKFRKRGESIALEPANSKHKIQIYGKDRVEVQGKLVGLLRHY